MEMSIAARIIRTMHAYFTKEKKNMKNCHENFMNVGITFY